MVSDFDVPPEDQEKIATILPEYTELILRVRDLAKEKLTLDAVENSLLSEDKDKIKILQNVCTLLEFNECKSASDDDQKNTLNALKEKRRDKKQKFDTRAEKLQEDKLQFAKKINLENVIVMRWQINDDNQTHFSASDLSNTDVSNQTGRSGIAIYGNLRIQTLFIGEDYIDVLRMHDSWKGRASLLFPNIPTFQILAKYINYRSDEEIVSYKSFEASFSQAKLKAIQQALKNGQDATKIGLSFINQFMADIGNAGRIRKTSTRVNPYCFFPPRLHEAYQAKGFVDNKLYSTIYAIEPQVQFWIGLVADFPETDLAKIWSMNNMNKREELLRQYGYQCGAEDPITLDGKTWNAFEQPFSEDLFGAKKNMPPNGASQ